MYARALGPCMTWVCPLTRYHIVPDGGIRALCPPSVVTSETCPPREIGRNLKTIDLLCACWTMESPASRDGHRRAFKKPQPTTRVRAGWSLCCSRQPPSPREGGMMLRARRRPRRSSSWNYPCRDGQKGSDCAVKYSDVHFTHAHAHTHARTSSLDFYHVLLPQKIAARPVQVLPVMLVRRDCDVTAARPDLITLLALHNKTAHSRSVGKHDEPTPEGPINTRVTILSRAQTVRQRRANIERTSHRHWSTYFPGGRCAGMRTVSTISTFGSRGPPFE
jgi:hypothetical protein